MKLPIRTTIGQTLDLFFRHWVWMCAEFIALGILIDGLFLLFNAEATGLILGNAPGVSRFEMGSYYVYLATSSLLFTLLFAHQFLRLWLLGEVGVGEPAVVQTLIRTTLVPLLILQLAVDVLFILSLVMLVFLSPFVFGLGLMIMPAILIERRGWGAVERNFQMIRGIWGRLVGISAVLLVLLVLTTIFATGFANALLGTVDTGLPVLVYSTLTDLPSILVNALTLCLILVVYRWITERESGRDLPDIFR